MPQGGGSGHGGAAATGGAGGLVIGTLPPLSIPPAPASGTLIPCDSMAAPEGLALLDEDHVVVTQFFGQSQQRLVRLWTVSTNALETLFETQNRHPLNEETLSASDDGRHLFEIVIESGGEGAAVRIFDLAARKFTASSPVQIAAVAVSSDGKFILDRDLRRFTADGQPDFDFTPLLATAFPSVTSWRWRRTALSPKGSAIAIEHHLATDGTPSVVVAWQGGKVVNLTDSPPLTPCLTTALSFSPDERFLLARGCATLRVWDLDSATAVVKSSDPGLTAVAFAKAGSRLVTADASGVIERDLDGANPVAWPVDGRYPFVLGAAGVLGHREDGALAVLARGQVLGTWRHPRRTWERAVAVTADASFTIADDWTAPANDAPGARQMLARFAADRAGPTAILSTTERQTEWEGQIAPSPEGRRLAVAFPDSVRIVDMDTLRMVASLATEAGTIAWSPDGQYIAVTPSFHYRDLGRVAYVPPKAVALWDARSGAMVATFATPVYPRGTAFDETGRFLRGWGSEVTVSADSTGFVSFRPAAERASFAIDLVTAVVSPATQPSFVASARDIVVEDGGIFRVSTGAALATFAGLPPLRAAFSADLSLAFVSDELGGRLLALGDGHLVAQGPRLISAWRPTALSPDGRRLAIDDSIYCLGP